MTTATGRKLKTATAKNKGSTAKKVDPVVADTIKKVAGQWTPEQADKIATALGRKV